MRYLGVVRRLRSCIKTEQTNVRDIYNGYYEEKKEVTIMLTTNVTKEDGKRFKINGKIDGARCTVNGTVIEENFFIVLKKLVEA